MGEINEKACEVNKNLTTNLSNVESVHSQFGSHISKKNELNFVTTNVQASKWNHTTLFVGAYLLSMIVYPLTLKTHKLCNVLSISFSKLLVTL